ncbi:hypothetical protein FRC03_012274 [Tulasnella sp. 419]|nr:hypothetical protein FRC03_012274 [Tulasnella sp. 419]
MSMPPPPDCYRNNKRQRSLNTSMQIPATIQLSGAVVDNKPFGSQLPGADGVDSVAHAPGILVATLGDLCQQLDELGLPALSHVMGEVMDVVSSIKNQDVGAMIEKICDLCYQVAVPVIEIFKEGNATSMVENALEKLTRNLQSTIAEYHQTSAEARCHLDLQANITGSFLESVICVLQQSVDINRHNGVEERDIMKEAISAMSRDTGDTLDLVQRIHAEAITIQQRISSFTSSKADVAELNAIQAIQPRVDSARYDSISQISSSFCLEETRVELLKQIQQWVEDPNSRTIFWLCGMAGTGKTTITRTLAKGLDESNYLGASFFFSRDEDNRRTTDLLFPTIAYQLACRVPSIWKYIVGALAVTPDVCTAMMRTQLNKLIVEPLLRAIPRSSPLVIVMDALDECTKEAQITEMLVLLAPAIRVIRSNINLKLFLTSRPEVHISAEFKEPGMEAVSSVSILHDIENSLVRSDISRYVQHHLHQIARVILLGATAWPTSEEMEALIDMADGLFIFAAVTVAYIGDTKHRQPKQRLRNILAARGQNQGSVSLKHLDVLYQQILVASSPDCEDEDAQATVQRIQEIIATVVLVIYPLSSRSLENLLKWEEGTVEPILAPFHSVLSIPPDPTPIRVFHKSFPDFLTEKRRSGKFWFHIQPTEHHGRLALLSLDHMNATLRRDICDVGNRSVSEIHDVQSILRTKVQEHVLYGCRNWATHLREATRTEKLEAALKHFCENILLYWLEILCLDGKLSSAILALDMAMKWTRNEASFEILANGYRYVLYYRNALSLGPWHIYRSTLPFVPRHNLSRSPWERELQASPRVISTDGHDRWDRVLFTLTTHSSPHSREVNAVAYSPNGELIATGSDHFTVIIWDSRTGAQIHILRGHSEDVMAVDFSPDGNLVASGSRDASVCIWNSATGIRIHTLERHSSCVEAVSFSPLGGMIASGSDDKTIILWDSGTGGFIRMLSGHPGWVGAVIFSLDGAQIVSGSDDSSIIIWDTKTGTVVSRLNETEFHFFPVFSITFSPDGTQLASTSDQDVILWNYESRSISRRLKGSTGDLLCVAFSPHGRFVVAGCATGEVITWDIISGSQIDIFSGHTGPVMSVAISPDGSRIVTGSSDHTATVWDMSSCWENDKRNSVTNQISHMDRAELPPDDNPLVSSTDNTNVALSDIGRHSLIHIPKGHRERVTTVAFSADGRYVASGSDDKTIIVWDTESGEPIKTLNVGSQVVFLEFSLDGRYLVAACGDLEDPALEMWTVEVSRPWQSSTIMLGKIMEVLSGSPAGGSPPSGTYLARCKYSQWVEKRCQGATVERICHLPQQDITASASFGRTFTFGTNSGKVYFLDFPPETFGITAVTMYRDDDNELDYSAPPPLPPSPPSDFVEI